MRHSLTKNSDFVDGNGLASLHQVEPHTLGEGTEEAVEVRKCVSFVFDREFRVLVVPH